MASSSKILVTPSERPVYGVPQLHAANAEQVTSLLQENHDQHHIFFSPSGFHNHTVHHILSLYALGAPASAIESQYNDHKKSQRSLGSVDHNVVKSMHDPHHFQEYLNREEHYHNYLEFFRDEISRVGYEAVVLKYLLSGSDQADDLLTRCFGGISASHLPLSYGLAYTLLVGFLHPLIHLGFALEFKQPAIVAEALAQAALHRDYLAPFFFGAEKQAKQTSQDASSKTKTLYDLLDEIRANEKLATSAHWDDDNKIRDGVLVRAPQEMIDIASQWTVRSGDLEIRNAEMVNAVVYYTIGAQQPPKQIKFDFYFMHCVNCSIFFSSILEQPWLSQEQKCRLLEWKARNDLVMYASRRAPEVLEDEWKKYQPKKAGSWADLFARVAALPEDGHACKMLRALRHGQELCSRFEDRSEIRIKGDDWLTLGHMLMDSVEDTGKTWVRSAGFSQAWDNFEDRER